MRSPRSVPTASPAATASTQTSPARRSTANKAARGCRSMRSKGFTLVEILVVLVIIAIMVSLDGLSLNATGRDTQLDDESRRLVGLIGLLHERAILESRDFGMRIEP